jgi:hypothetical protein
MILNFEANTYEIIIENLGRGGFNMAGTYVDGKVYVFTAKPDVTAFCIDLSTRSSAQIASHPLVNTWISCCAFKGKVYLTGAQSNLFVEYDPLFDSYRTFYGIKAERGRSLLFPLKDSLIVGFRNNIREVKIVNNEPEVVKTETLANMGNDFC